ncbi:MAG: integrase arm-type DNA-binding domain-containing protein, partial [Alphaproteobacteria bacterium]
MAKIKLTPAAVERIRPPKTGRAEYFDHAIPGFCLRVTDRGWKSWALMYRHRGKLRRLTLGTYPALGLLKARRAARGALEAVADGTDPAIAKREARRRDETEKHGTFAAVAEDFLNRHGKTLRPRSLEEVERPFKKWLLPRWGDRLISDIMRRDIIDLIDDLMDAGTPVAANRTLAVV